MGSSCPVRQFVEKGGIPTLGRGAGFGPVEAMTIQHCDDVSGRAIECAIPSDGDFCTRCSDESLGSGGWVDKVYGRLGLVRTTSFDRGDIEHAGCAGHAGAIGLGFGGSRREWKGDE